MNISRAQALHALRTHQAQRLAEILKDVDREPTTQRHYPGSNGGDSAKLRGIPAIGRNVAGAIPGTTPHQL